MSLSRRETSTLAVTTATAAATMACLSVHDTFEEKKAETKSMSSLSSSSSPPYSNASLAKRFGVDVFSASVTALALSPFVTTIDKSVAAWRSGRSPDIMSTVRRGVAELFTKPIRYVARKEFLFVWGIYTATYATANLAMSTSMMYGKQKREDAAVTTFAATTAVNIPASVMQDRFFTRWFGATRPKPLPLGSYGLFGARDAMTVLASFSLPHIVADHYANGNEERRNEIFVKAQVVCPVAIQLISTPLHVIGLHMYNSPDATLAERVGEVKRSYTKTAFMRFCRILPAFGIAGVLNNGLRDYGEQTFLPENMRLDGLEIENEARYAQSM